ncbi:PrgI family protein [Actinomyces weissii]|uniref:PrgI family protein n=1 Tax=Actinomyces weissii TaxID=675090 RepID=A0A7T7S2A0_9ACTO|nr:PrgI family protein [Actinomyces weissii]QQM67470.1 PrgI family protein [Actinomyces weissii]
MALEIKVYREITAYQSKPMLGMTWRQMGCVAVGLPVVGGIYALCLWAGQSELGSWLAALLTMPFIAFGWVRPKGLSFETYLRYIWRYKWEPQRRLYKSESLTVPQIDSERYVDAVRSQKVPKRAVVRRLELEH